MGRRRRHPADRKSSAGEGAALQMGLFLHLIKPPRSPEPPSSEVKSHQ